jgi:hypothetical protein
MKMMKALPLLAGVVLAFFSFENVAAQEKAGPEISNIGLKFNLGLGSQKFTDAQELKENGAGSLSLGYGVSQYVTLWLSAQAGTFQSAIVPQQESDFVGLELLVQYKLRPGKKFRPYGKAGLGAYFLGTNYSHVGRPGEVLTGGGIAWALGAEYRLFRVLAIGAELYWKDLEYKRRRLGDGDFVDLPRAIQGDTHGIMLNFTLH